MQLRDYQQDGIDQIRHLMRCNVKRVCYQLPTGGGKTVQIAYIAKNAMSMGRRVLILAHRTELILQASDELKDMGVTHGIIQAGISPRTSRQIQVASVQTIVRRLDRVGDYDLIIIDEAHHAPAGNYQKILKQYPGAKVLGFTATPRRLDGKGLDSCFDELVTGPTIHELIQMGNLKQPKIFAPDIIDTSKLRSRFGDFEQKELEEITDKPTITGCAVSAYRKYGNNWPAIVRCVSIAHSEHVAEAFRTAGYRAQSINGKTPHPERKKLLSDLGQKNLDLLMFCDLIGEGVNIPVVSVCIDLAPSQSLTKVMQFWGRGLRPAPGYPHAVILDHAGNSFRHGHPASDREWSLTGESKKAKKNPELSVRQCPKCYAVHTANLRQCPECGLLYPIAQEERQEFLQREGELAEISEEQIKQLRRRELGRARTLEDLQRVEKERGYKPGWAHHIHSARQRKSA
jgi:DNA repair protein RadD